MDPTTVNSILKFAYTALFLYFGFVACIFTVFLVIFGIVCYKIFKGKP